MKCTVANQAERKDRLTECGLAEEITPGAHFRTARLEDAPAVTKLLGQLGYAMPLAGVQSSLQAVLADTGIHVILACSADEEVLGLMTLRLFPVLRLGGDQLSIEEMVVAPQHRGLGIGREFVRYATAFARQKGVVRVEVLSSSGRESTKRGFYLKNGFQPAESRVYRIHYQL